MNANYYFGGMKQLLLATTFLLPLGAAAQTAATAEAPAPFKGANTILLHTPDSTGPALNKMARALIVAGIEPDKIEPQIGYLTARGHSSGSMNPATFDYRIVASPEPGGTLLTISGTCNTRASFTQTIAVPMVWGASGNAKGCFALIEPIALSYTPAKIGYLKKGENKAVLH